ncbi:MAG: ABC transporter substrate-binding protein [Verrucomicrobiae bacterium]|nr:ABC transporter substrate-binding protein [Verrucomicrobiae bacterium]
MFFPLAQGKIDTGDLRFEHILQDIQTLNERAQKQELDVSAVSIHAFPRLAENYALMACGASMGDGYGPMLVAPKEHPRADWRKLRIAVPGTLTSAYLALRIHMGEFEYVVVPFDEIFAAIREGRADAGLIIHEGQLTYRKENLHCLVDLGQWWKDTTGLPLPLGGNIVRRGLGWEMMSRVTSIVRQSIVYALAHPEEGYPHLAPYARDLDAHLTQRFVGMYVNDYTVDYGETGKQAIREFLRRGEEVGLIRSGFRLEFVG